MYHFSRRYVTEKYAFEIELPIKTDEIKTSKLEENIADYVNNSLMKFKKNNFKQKVTD